MLMALRELSRAELGALLDLSATSIGHKFNGRSKWTLEEIELLSEYAGSNWPAARFFEDPEPGGPTNGLPRRDSNTEPSVSLFRRRATRVSWSQHHLRRVS